jgi:hypothetical protein
VHTSGGVEEKFMFVTKTKVAMVERLAAWVM